VLRLVAIPRTAASRAPALPARAKPICVNVRRRPSVLRSRKRVSPSTCSVNVRTTRPALLQTNRRTCNQVLVDTPAITLCEPEPNLGARCSRVLAPGCRPSGAVMFVRTGTTRGSRPPDGADGSFRARSPSVQAIMRRPGSAGARICRCRRALEPEIPFREPFRDSCPQ
jgi:hypothetical protein